MKAAFSLAVLLLLSVSCVSNAHRLMLQSPPELQATPASSSPPNNTASPQPSLNGTGSSSSNDSWPFPEIPVRLMSRGDLLAQGGAVRALGRDKLLRIKQQSSVDLDVDALAQSMETDDDLVSHAGLAMASMCSACVCLCLCLLLLLLLLRACSRFVLHAQRHTACCIQASA